MARGLETWVGPNSGENGNSCFNYKGPYEDQIEVNAARLNSALRASQMKLILASADCPYSPNIGGMFKFFFHIIGLDLSGTMYADGFSVKDFNSEKDFNSDRQNLNCQLVRIYDRSIWDNPNLSTVTPESCASRINAALTVALDPLRYNPWAGYAVNVWMAFSGIVPQGPVPVRTEKQLYSPLVRVKHC